MHFLKNDNKRADFPKISKNIRKIQEQATTREREDTPKNSSWERFIWSFAIEVTIWINFEMVEKLGFYLFKLVSKSGTADFTER